MSNITIPPEALEAAMRAYPKLTRDEAMWIVGCALKAWPGMKLTPYWEHMTHKRRVEMILPLTENSNDKA